MAEAVRKKVGLELGSEKKEELGTLSGSAGLRRGARPHPHLQHGEYVYQRVLAQRIHDAFVVNLYGLHHSVLFLVRGVEADQADYVGHRQEDGQGQIYGLSILGGQEITK